MPNKSREATSVELLLLEFVPLTKSPILRGLGSPQRVTCVNKEEGQRQKNWHHLSSQGAKLDFFRRLEGKGFVRGLRARVRARVTRRVLNLGYGSRSE